jgi:AraC-like DNA-binding protein
MAKLAWQRLQDAASASRRASSSKLAGYRVGCGDASHFTREYKRLFGAPPMRDVEQLREAASNGRLQELAGSQ